jgi:hypothetical protein
LRTYSDGNLIREYVVALMMDKNTALSVGQWIIDTANKIHQGE